MKLIKIKIVSNKFIFSQLYTLFQLDVPMNLLNTTSFCNSMRQILLRNLLCNFKFTHLLA